MFAGGVLVEENPSNLPPLADVDRTHNITWTRGPGGSVTAQIGDYVFDDANGRGGTHQVIRAITPDGTAAASLDLLATNPGYIPAALRTQVRVGTTNGGSRVLLDDTGASDFLQLRTTINIKMQVFSVTLPTTVGTFSGTIALPTAWPNNHLYAVLSAIDFQASGVGATLQGGASGLTQCGIRIWNNPSAQNVSVTVISFGN